MGEPVVRQKDPHAGCTLNCGVSMDVRVTNVRVNGDQPAAAAGPTLCTMGPGAHGPGDAHVIFKPIGPAIAVGQPTGCGGVESAGSPNVVLHGSAEIASWAQQLFDTISDEFRKAGDFLNAFAEEFHRLETQGHPDPAGLAAAALGAAGGGKFGGDAGMLAGIVMTAPAAPETGGAATLGGAVGGRVLGTGIGVWAGGNVGYHVGVAEHAFINLMKASISSTGTATGGGGPPPPKVLPEKVVNALSGFKNFRFQVEDQIFQLDKAGIKHILERHVPDYFNGTVKAAQSFFPKGTSIDQITKIVSAIMQQNRTALLKIGSAGYGQLTGEVDGVEYVLGLNRGRIAQLYPK